jgi:hypothetical protein
MWILILVLSSMVLVAPAPAWAQVRIDIGIHLPGPPPLVIVPEVRAVQYVPAAPANLFFYGNQYWAFVNGGWHVSAGYNGPWIVVAPQIVPRPVLLVPVQYYRVPPGHWEKWNKHHPPAWGHEWGREWAAKRQWKDRDDDQDGRGSRHEGDGHRGKGHSKGHGHGKGR